MTEELLDDFDIDVKRTKKQRKVKLPKKLEKDEVKRLLDAPNRSAITGLRNRCMMELMYRAGLRVSEVCGLKPRDISLKNHIIQVWEGKGGDRTTAFAEGTALDFLLEEWVRRRKIECAKSDYFFCTIRGGQVSTRYVQQMMKRMGRRAGFNDDDVETRITPHKLRHTFATEFLEAGGKIEHLQLLLGHKHIATTQIYMHIRPEDAIAAVLRMGKKK